MDVVVISSFLPHTVPATSGDCESVRSCSRDSEKRDCTLLSVSRDRVAEEFRTGKVIEIDPGLDCMRYLGRVNFS